jgi:hypothetical protein
LTQTIQQIISAAFTIIGVVADGKQPTATQSAKGLEILNDNMLTQQRDGWHLGWYPITSITSLPNPAPLRDEDIGDVKLCLCAWLCVAYGVTLAPSPDPNDPTSLINQIKAAFTRLNKRSLLYTESDLGELQRPQGGPWGGPNWL